jgi:polyhydroxybutyrate depolymerase
MSEGMEQGTAAGTTIETMRAAGETRSFRLHAPAAQSGRLPVVLCFHGRNDDGARIEKWSRLSILAEREGFIAVYPEGLEAKWRITSTAADIVFVEEILKALRDRVPIDPDRIYAAGISNGAQMAWRLACERADDFAAFGLVAGSYPRVCGEGDRPPLIVFHGTLDLVLPYGGGKNSMPVRNFAIGWAARPGCRLGGRGEVVLRRGEAVGERWSCAPGGEVELYTLHGSGHSWPGSDMPAQITSRDVDASALMWAFFKAHPRRAPRMAG